MVWSKIIWNNINNVCLCVIQDLLFENPKHEDDTYIEKEMTPPPTSQGQNSRQDYHMCIFCCPDICHVLFCISHGRFLSDHPSNNITIWNINRILPSGISCHTMCQSNLLIKITWFLFWLFSVAIRTHEQCYWLFTAINKS